MIRILTGRRLSSGLLCLLLLFGAVLWAAHPVVHAKDTAQGHDCVLCQHAGSASADLPEEAAIQPPSELYVAATSSYFCDAVITCDCEPLPPRGPPSITV